VTRLSFSGRYDWRAESYRKVQSIPWGEARKSRKAQMSQKRVRDTAADIAQRNRKELTDGKGKGKRQPARFLCASRNNKKKAKRRGKWSLDKMTDNPLIETPRSAPASSLGPVQKEPRMG